MPVGTLATVKGVPQDVLEELGVQILLNNTYHLYLRPGVETVRQLGGVQKFMAWHKPDPHRLGWLPGLQPKRPAQAHRGRRAVPLAPRWLAALFLPESSLAAEIGLGADIIMAFDECTEFPAARERSRQSMEIDRCAGPAAAKIISRAQARGSLASEAILASASGDSGGGHTQALFGIVQGGMYADLRRESAERTVEMAFPGYAIGGLSVGEPRQQTWEMVEAAIALLPAGRPRYVMGVGTPEEIVQYAALGVDMMDCVLPTRAARHGLLFTSQGKVSIKKQCYARDEAPLDPNCGCKVCLRYSRAYLRHLYSSDEILAQVLNTVHNLSYYLDTLRRVRHAIKLGEFAGYSSAV